MPQAAKWRIAFISAIPSEKSFLPFHLHLQQACRKADMQLDLFKNGHFLYWIEQKRRELHYEERLVNPEDYALALARFSIKAAHGGDYYALRAFEDRGIPVINPPNALINAKDKLRTLEILREGGLPVTPTAIVRTRREIARALEFAGGPPYIIKDCFGSEGKKVLQASTPAQVYAIFDYLWRIDRNQIALVQPYLGSDPVSDVRALYFDYRPWRALHRFAKKGEFRCNIHAGAGGTPIELDPLELEMCEKAARLSGLPFVGIDFLRTKDGPVFLEVNGCPGMDGIVASYGKIGMDLLAEFAGMLADYIREHGKARA